MPLAALVSLLLVLPTAAAPEAFDLLVRRAQAARDAGRNDEAIAAYRAAVEQRPAWDEGWWYLGVLLYESQSCDQADGAFEKFLALKPQAGPGWAIRGVCAFDRGDHPRAIEWIQKGLALGLGGNAELLRVAVTRLALAYVKTGQFELSIRPLTVLSRLALDAPGLVEATGLALLRLNLLPAEIPEARRELVRRLGRAGSLHLARKGEEAGRAYADVAAAYPDEPGVHYAYGVFLLRSGNEQGLAELRRAVELRPEDVLAHLDIAFELLERGDATGAKESASRAVALAPALFAGHVALGRALVELGELDAGTRELETAVRLAPESYETHFALARAYAKSGRSEDAARERAAFAALEAHGQGAAPGVRGDGSAHP
jgi:tetratricopeptide (TPR) repeat protein